MFSSDVLWEHSAVWREVQTALDHHMCQYVRESTALDNLAGSIAGNLQAVDPVMEDLCRETCPHCPAPCCLHADVRYDLRDLVFLHTRQEALPLHQPRQQTGRPCSFLGQNGCMLPRGLRPFMCTWYLCPGQMAIIRNDAGQDMISVLAGLQRIKELRKELEATFISMVSGISPRRDRHL